MARTRRLVVSAPLFVALVASCSGGGGDGPGGAAGDDPQGVTEKVGRLVQRFSYGASGPYAGAPAGDGKVFQPSQGGAFEGADSGGAIRSPSLDGGAFDRAGACDALCDFVAGCFSVAVPANCGATCGAQLNAVAAAYGAECTAAVLDFYSCIVGALVCGRGGAEGEGGVFDGEQDGDQGGGRGVTFSIAPDFASRCASSIAGLLVCIGKDELDEGVLPGDGAPQREQTSGFAAGTL